MAAGADAVVGVRLRRGGDDWAGRPGGVRRHRHRGPLERYDLEDAPAALHLSGQDFAKLVRHGFWPVGIVGGSTVAYVVTGSRQQWRSRGLFSGRRNQELPDFTRGLYDARALAMDRLTRGAHELHAHGVVGVTIERSEQSASATSAARPTAT